MNNPQQFPAILVYGLGNPDRGDDGIGSYCIDKIHAQIVSFHISPSIETKKIFHLTIDELETAARFSSIVVFDASINENIADIHYQQIQPAAGQQFTTHLLTPEEFLFSLIKLFNSCPTMHLISIRGYTWNMCNYLSPQAKANADKAIEFFLSDLITLNGFE